MVKKWINCAKCLAILAVMVDHTNGILYTNQNVAISSYYSVSLFIIISGMMSFLSNERHRLNWSQTFLRSSRKIVIAYLIANAIYLICITKSFDTKTYIQYVISFNLSDPFYYVLLYIQLMLVSKLLYSIIRSFPQKAGWIYELGVGLIILLLCSWTTNNTNVLDVYGGGGKILGGTYLFLFYVGMIISKHDPFKTISLKKSIILLTISSIACFAWWKFECINCFQLDAKLPFGPGINPPSISSGLMAVIILILSYSLFTLFEFSKYTHWITDSFSYIGTHTLYIFLYHSLLLDYLARKYIDTYSIWIKRFSYFAFMIFGSVLLEYFIYKIGNIGRMVLNQEK